jgi:hypothetical protein
VSVTIGNLLCSTENITIPLQKGGFKKMAEEILEKIPLEKRWEMAAQSFSEGCMGYIQVLLGIIGKEKLAEIESKMWSEGMKMSFLRFKDELKLPVEDAVDAANMMGVFAFLMLGPDCTMERVEESRNRVVDRYINCPWWETAKQFGIADQYECSCGEWSKEGLKAINPKLAVTVTKSQPRGDPYCECVYELKE